MQIHADLIRRTGLRRAFTLIELLVVVSIISLLIALLLPALSKAKQEAKNVYCKNNIKGLLIGIHQYFAQYNDSLPINGTLFPKSGVPQIYQSSADTKFKNAEVTDPQKWRLEYGALWKEMGGQDIQNLWTMPAPALPLPDRNLARKFLCPTDLDLGLPRTNLATSAGKAPLTLRQQSNGAAAVTLGPGAPGYWSYSVNAVTNSLGRLRDNPIFRNSSGQTSLPWSDPIARNKIRTETDFIYFLEEDQDSLFNDEVFEPPTLRDATTNSERLTNRHNGGGNVGYLDGHADWFNEIVFDNGTSTNAITRMFFPDGGEFLNAP